MGKQARADISPGASRSAGAAVLVALLSLVHPVATTADPAGSPVQVDALPQFTSLDEFDTLLLARDRMIRTVRDEAGGADSLIFGRPLAAYADQYLFNAAAEARLAELRARAAAQAAGGATAALAGTLGQARSALELETYRLATLYAQKTLSSGIAEHEAALDAFLDKVPAAEQQQTRARLAPLLEQARRGVDALMQIPTLTGLQQALEREPSSPLPQAFNEERMRLAPFAAAWDREHGVTPMSRTRSKPCSPPHSPPSPSGRPQVDPAVASQPEYPPEARRLGFEGKVHVRAEISAKGCAERMEIARSSGVESLDASALEWAEGLRFLPAQVNGMPQTTGYTFGVAFKLTE
jgi:TonB family protein